MYESSRRYTGMAQRHRQKSKRRAARGKRLLLGVAVAICLLTCVRQAYGKSPATQPADTITAQPESGPKGGVSPSQEVPQAPNSAGSAPVTAPVTSENDWKLLLVNTWNLLPQDYAVSLTQLKNEHAIDERCYPDLQAMMDDCRAAGLRPVICSSYRTQEKQERLFENQMQQFFAKGYSAEQARTEAGKSVAVPGTSEHQSGLAVDIVDLANQNLDSSQEKTAVQKWLMKNSWRYGFILRYPNDKREITGIIYEPWHYRYVGKQAAEEIYAQGICLEEYVENRAQNTALPS